MLERIPAAKAALCNPSRPETKAAIVAAIKAQLPLLSEMKKYPNMVLSELINVDPDLLEDAKSNPEKGFHLALLQILSGRVDEEKLLERRLSFPLPISDDVLALAKEVGAIWDIETQKKKGQILSGAFADPSSEMSALFSLREDTRVSMGVLLANAVSGNGRIADLKALAAFRSGQIKFDGLKAYYEKKGILLLSAESMEDRVILKSGDNPIHMIGIERQLGNLQETAREFRELVAKRISVGFTPLL